MTRRRLGIPIVGLLAALVLWVAVIGQVGRERARLLEEAGMRADASALALEAHTRRVLSAVDAVLVDLVEDSGGLASAVVLQGLATRLGAVHPSLVGIAVIDQDGRMIASTLGPVLGFVPADDRDYVQANIVFDPARPIIGRPLPEPLTGRLLTSLSRRITRPGGGFGGVVVAFLDPAELARGEWLALLGRDASTGLVRTDAIVLARIGPGPEERR